MTQAFNSSNEQLQEIFSVNSSVATSVVSNDITTMNGNYHGEAPYIVKAFSWLTNSSVHISCHKFLQPNFITGIEISSHGGGGEATANDSLILLLVKHEVALTKRYSKTYVKELEDIICILQQEITIK